MKEWEEYRKRLEYYKVCLQKNPRHMQAADNCMRRSDKMGTVLQSVRSEIFLHVWAPVITEFVEWVLEEAIKDGKKRLYFLARDGYMMYLLAKKLVEMRCLDLDIRYLKVSRSAIRRAEYCFLGREALDTLCSCGMDVSFEKIMKRANLTEEEALYIARLTGYEDNYKTALNSGQIYRLKSELSRIDPLFVYMQKHSADHYETTVAYLRQEGLFQEISYALVDSGWVGTLQLSLQRVLEHETGREIRLQGYYFGIYERPKGTTKGQYRAFYFRERHIRRKIRFSNCLFETVFSAPEGMTCGYGMSGQKVSKLLGLTGADDKKYEAIENENKNPNAEVMKCFTELLMRYVSYYGVTGNDADLSGDEAAGNEENHKKRIRFVECLLKPMMGSPTRLEAEAFGELLFCDDVLELQLQPVAAVWKEEELYKRRFFYRILIRMDLKSGTLPESAWAEGSITRLGKQVDKNMRQERLYKSFMYLRKAIGK